MSLRHFTLNLIARQYNERWRFLEYDRAIKKLQCHQIHSFLSCNPQNFEGIMHEYDVPVYVCKFSPLQMHCNVLAVANENGTVCIENTTKRRHRTYVQTHNNTVFDLAWVPGEKQFVTVSGDHSAKLWDCGESDIKMVSEFLGHTRSVKCVNFKPENTSVFATGSRDGLLILWDARCSKRCSNLPMSHVPDQIIHSAAGTSPYIPKRKYYPVEASQSNSVTGLIFQNESTLISSGSSDQCIRVWDMRKTYSRSASMPVPKYQLVAPSTGFSHLCIDPSGTKLYANSMDSYIYCFDVNSYYPDPIAAFYGHQNGSFYVKSSVSHNGRYLLSGSSDKCAYIWNTRNAELSEIAIKPFVALPGHTEEVSCVVMCSMGDMKVATCSDDGTYRLWYSYNLENMKDRGDVVDAAEYLNRDCSEIVRNKWKNKRKRDDLGDTGIKLNLKKSCSFHSKVRHYYNNSLCVVSCNCHRLSNESSMVTKRLREDDEDENAQLSKKCSHWEMQEFTPPRSNDVTTVIRGGLHDLKCSGRNNTVIKLSLKRKLSDLSNFGEDVNQKRKCLESGLLNVNGVKDECMSGNEDPDVSHSQLENLSAERSSHQPDVANKDSCEKLSETVEYLSPTTNLPNYVKDGTSPYIHRCPKTQKENLDWLTKLRRNNAQNEEASPSNVKELPNKAVTPKSSGKVPIACSKRKNRNHLSAVEGKSVNQTLHKYFKISNKSAEINGLSQDFQKKSF